MRLISPESAGWYETRYGRELKTPSRRQYRPDFTITFSIRSPDGTETEKTIYLEHQALDEVGNPPSWMSGQSQISAVVTGGEKKLVAYLDQLIGTQGASSDFAVALRLEMKFEKAATADAIKVQFSKDPDAVKVVITEEDALKNFPWTYDELTARLKDRYSNFVANNSYHKLRRSFETNPKLFKMRFLDPTKTKGLKKPFYNPNIVAEFDKHYTITAPKPAIAPPTTAAVA